jgi:hypothetical protein
MVVYRLTSLITGKVYIGITQHSAKRRFAAHWDKAMRSNVGSDQPHLSAALRKYGRSTWRVETIATADTWSALCELERRFISEHRANDPRCGYNLTEGGDGRVGVRQTPEEIARRVAKMRGQHRSPEARLRMSLAMKGKKKSPEHIARMAASKRGHHKTPEQIDKSARFHRGRKRSATTCFKHSVYIRAWNALHPGARKTTANPVRDAAIACEFFSATSLGRAGVRFGIRAAATCHALKRFRSHLRENLEATSALYAGVLLPKKVHPEWADLAR